MVQGCSHAHKPNNDKNDLGAWLGDRYSSSNKQSIQSWSGFKFLCAAVYAPTKGVERLTNRLNVSSSDRTPPPDCQLHPNLHGTPHDMNIKGRANFQF